MKMIHSPNGLLEYPQYTRPYEYEEADKVHNGPHKKWSS